MSVYPPPQPGYAAPPPGGHPPRNAPRGNANGVIAAVVAGVVIVLGVVSTVLLVTSDANTEVHAGLGSGSNPPSGSGRPTGSLPSGSGGQQRPTGQNLPTQGPTSVPSQGSADLSGATSAGNEYFDDLDSRFFYLSQGAWCEESAFPLTQADVAAVTSAYGLGSAQGSSAVATMRGHISLTDGRSGTLTIYLRPETSDGSAWCITSQSNLT